MKIMNFRIIYRMIRSIMQLFASNKFMKIRLNQGGANRLLIGSLVLLLIILVTGKGNLSIGVVSANLD